LIFFLFFILPCCLYANLSIFLIPAALFAANTVNIVDILILQLVLFVMYCSFAHSAGHQHFRISLHILFVHVTITLLESCGWFIKYVALQNELMLCIKTGGWKRTCRHTAEAHVIACGYAGTHAMIT